MLKKINLIFLLFFCLNSCAQNKPQNIEESIKYFETNWSAKEKDNFKRKSEKSAVGELHMTTGLWIRNNWIRNGNKSLVKQFADFGIYNPDDISGIILTSLHRKLNNKDLKLKEQAKYYIDYWKPIIANNEKSIKIANEIYEKYKIGDKITIYYPVDSNDGESNAVIYENNDKWVFNHKTDLKISGLVEKKFFLGNKRNVFFNLKITEMSNKKIKVLGEKMEIGKTYDFHLDKLTID
jgi:hypothetical protein